MRANLTGGPRPSRSFPRAQGFTTVRRRGTCYNPTVESTRHAVQKSLACATVLSPEPLRPSSALGTLLTHTPKCTRQRVPIERTPWCGLVEAAGIEAARDFNHEGASLIGCPHATRRG